MKLFLYLLILQLQFKGLGGDSCVHGMYCFGGKKSEECHVLKSVSDFEKWNITVENCDPLPSNFRLH